MIKLLLILLPFTASGQCEVRYDTVPTSLIDGVQKRLYNYYNKNGSLAWGAVAEYDPALIPVGGSFTIYIPGNKLVIKPGYKVYITSAECKMTLLEFLDSNKRRVVSPLPAFDATVIF